MLLAFLAVSLPSAAHAQKPLAPIAIPPQVPLSPQPASHDFTLRHIFHRGTYQDPHLHKRLDIQPQTDLWVSSADDPPLLVVNPHFETKANGLRIQRLADRRPAVVESYMATARLAGEAQALDASYWTMDEVEGPNVTDRDTVVNLATMAANAYAPTAGEGEWTDVNRGYNYSQSFGWEGDGLRGHIFADKGNSTIVISLKGTSPAVFDGDGTTTRDKLNDNLFFSCCCAQGGQYFWRQTCLVKALKNENRYYRSAIELYTNVTELYPDSNVWLTGHSLGGSVSGLLGLTFGVPVIAFEAPGEALAATRLGLPAPPGSDPANPQSRQNTGVYHFGHTADPVFMGSCNGATASCTLGGYAMETQCHTGMQCVYDTVQDFGWRVGIGNHKIHVVIDTVIKKYDKVPTCVPDDECRDCFLWKYFKSNGSDSTTTTTSTTTSKTRTRTSTCKTPGWWGCLDETTSTSTTSTSTSTTTTTTSTCKTPGWFGCNDPTTTSDAKSATPAPSHAPHSTPASSTASSTSCRHPGWFGGCDDPTPSTSRAHHHHPSSHKSSTCQTPGLFFGCLDKTAVTGTASHSITSVPTSTGTTPQPTTTQSRKDRCTRRVFFGMICLDSKEHGGGSTEDTTTRTDL